MSSGSALKPNLRTYSAYRINSGTVPVDII